MDVKELTRENQALNEQVELLVETERRLYSAQRVIERLFDREYLDGIQGRSNEAMRRGAAIRRREYLRDALWPASSDDSPIHGRRVRSDGWVLSGSPALRGSWTANVDPRPGWLSTRIVPPCASTS